MRGGEPARHAPAPSASAPETTVAAGDLALDPAVDGFLHGTVAVKFTYVRDARPVRIALSITHPPGLERDGTAWPPVRGDAHTAYIVDLAAPPARTMVSYTFAFKGPATTDGRSLQLDITALRADGVGLSGANPFDNSIAVAIRTVQ
ncbi:hypothetical protein OHA72_56835 [Dactylosporangium sp. NBC_01737]|uniref:hypothetical protein n=1 Tax=Dactylosporangium sp. NBC_01737 TaxID=2975959 RepID=UPI002E14F1EC|nr:hypothetical protein OHA72_56835 [Dactylosporangium sp. NBC_01737]